VIEYEPETVGDGDEATEIAMLVTPVSRKVRAVSLASRVPLGDRSDPLTRIGTCSVPNGFVMVRATVAPVAPVDVEKITSLGSASLTCQ
jgi:hypothetical protein